MVIGCLDAVGVDHLQCGNAAPAGNDLGGHDDSAACRQADRRPIMAATGHATWGGGRRNSQQRLPSPMLLPALLLLPLSVMAATQPASQPTGLDWDLILKALGFVVAVVATYLQIRNLGFATRASLKTDLEILKLIDSADPNHAKVKRIVDARIQALYDDQPAASSARQAERWAYGIGGGLWAVGFAYWTITLVLPGFSWWSLLTGYLALAGLGLTGMGISGQTLGAQLAANAAARQGSGHPG